MARRSTMSVGGGARVMILALFHASTHDAAGEEHPDVPVPLYIACSGTILALRPEARLWSRKRCHCMTVPTVVLILAGRASQAFRDNAWRTTWRSSSVRQVVEAMTVPNHPISWVVHCVCLVAWGSLGP